MRKLVVVLIAFLLSCACAVRLQRFAPERVVEKIDKHNFSIAVFYTMSPEEWKKRVQKKDLKEPGVIQKSELMVTYGDSEFERWAKLTGVEEVQGILSDQQYDEKGRPIKIVAYMGNGTCVKGDNVLTAAHLLKHGGDEVYSRNVWVFAEGLASAIEADVVAISDDRNVWDDYALVHLTRHLGLPGLKIAKPYSLKPGDAIIYTGSVGGLSFFTRYGFATTARWRLRRNWDGRLALKEYEKFDYWAVYPGGPGDSGGTIKNVKGEIVTILYCGIYTHNEQYIFGNPTRFLWRFLERHSLTWITE